MSMRRRRIPQVEYLESRLALNGQVAPLADPAPDPLPWVSVYDPNYPMPLDPPPPRLQDPSDPVDVPIPSLP